jgi:Zn-dependent membrane protease YugP
VGLGLGALSLAKLGLYLYLGVAIFQLVTLPVEFDASRRAMEFLRRMVFLYYASLLGLFGQREE